MNFPNHITFLSDEQEVEFISEIKGVKGSSEKSANYRFVKSKENLGKEFPMFLRDIEKLKTCGYCDFKASNFDLNSK